VQFEQKTCGFLTAQVEQRLPQAVVKKVWSFLGPRECLWSVSAHAWQNDIKHWLHFKVDCMTPQDWQGICKLRNSLWNSMSGCLNKSPSTDGFVRKHKRSRRCLSRTFKYRCVSGCSIVK